MIRAVAGICAVLMSIGLLSIGAARAAGLAVLWDGIEWGEPPQALLAQFGARAAVLPRPFDFGDSYAPLVLPDAAVGGVTLIAFFQIDKRTGGLKRIQLERQRHGVNPPAYRAVLAALEAELGAPDARCGIRPGPAGGYQAAAERVWRRGGVTVRAIFRDTTIEAFEGCLGGGPATGPCGLTGQLLIRISPPSADAGACQTPAAPR